MKYFIGGVNGSGKTTLLHKIKEARPDFEIIKSSQVLMNFLNISGDYEALRNLPHEKVLLKLEEMMNNLIENRKNIIFDSHYLNLVRGKIKAVTGDWIKKFDAIFLIDVNPETALNRMQSDSRDRAIFPAGISMKEKKKMYSEYIKKTKIEFKNIAEKWNIPFRILNGEKDINETLEEFINFNKLIESEK
jgi:thymidylate kinase